MPTLLAFLRHSRPALVVLALSGTALLIPGLWSVRSACILILVGSVVWLLTSSLPQPSLTPAEPQLPIEPAKIEYERLSAFFDKLLSRTLAAFALIGAAAGLLLWKDIRDVRTDAEEVAKSEAKIAIKAQLEEPKLKEQIHDAVQEKVGPAVEDAIKQNLAQRIQNFENESSEIATLAGLVTLVKIEAGNRRVGDSLHAIIEKQYSPSPPVREFAKRSLREVAQWYEESSARGGHDLKLRLGQDRPQEMIATIKRNPGAAYPYEVWRAFHDMRVLTGWNVEVFDSRAAVKWCAEHKPKCYE